MRALVAVLVVLLAQGRALAAAAGEGGGAPGERPAYSLLQLVPPHVTGEAEKQAHYDFVTSHVQLFRARAATAAHGDVLKDHQEALLRLQDSSHPEHYAGPVRFVVRLDSRSTFHETLWKMYSMDKYHIFNSDTGLLTVTSAEMNALKAQHPVNILDFTPLLASAKVADTILDTCYDYQKAKGILVNGTASSGGATAAAIEPLEMIEDGVIKKMPATIDTPLTEISVETTALPAQNIVNLIAKIQRAYDGGLVLSSTEAPIDGVNNHLTFSFDGDADPTCAAFEARIAAISNYPEIQWISRKIKIVTFNRWAKGICQTASSVYTPFTKRSNVALTGKGQIVAVSDTGLDMSSCYFYDPLVPQSVVKSKDGSATSSTHRKVMQYITYADDCDDGTEAHGTHVAGTIAGYSTASKAYGDFVRYNGVAPEAKLSIFDIGVADLKTGLKTGNVETDMMPLQYTIGGNPGARIFSWSWGCKAESKTSDCGGAYASNSQQVDSFLYKHPDAMAFIANGNTGQSATGVSYTVGAPATAKSCVSVGASMSENGAFKAFSSSVLDGVSSDFDINALSYFSSRGPTSDGRIKPDVTAPGRFLRVRGFDLHLLVAAQLRSHPLVSPHLTPPPLPLLFSRLVGDKCSRQF